LIHNIHHVLITVPSVCCYYYYNDVNPLCKEYSLYLMLICIFIIICKKGVWIKENMIIPFWCCKVLHLWSTRHVYEAPLCNIKLLIESITTAHFLFKSMILVRYSRKSDSILIVVLPSQPKGSLEILCTVSLKTTTATIRTTKTTTKELHY